MNSYDVMFELVGLFYRSTKIYDVPYRLFTYCNVRQPTVFLGYTRCNLQIYRLCVEIEDLKIGDMTLHVLQALLPLLRTAADYAGVVGDNKDSSMGCWRSAVINMSTRMGAISGNTDGGIYPYRCSKVSTVRFNCDLNLQDS